MALHISAAELYDRKARGERHPWERSQKRNDYDTGFINYLWEWLKTINSESPRVNAILHINNHKYTEDGLDKLYAHWEAHQEALSATREQSAASTSSCAAERSPQGYLLPEPGPSPVVSDYDPNDPAIVAARNAARRRQGP